MKMMQYKHILLSLIFGFLAVSQIMSQNLFKTGEYLVYTTIDNVNYFLADDGSLSLMERNTEDERQVWTIAPYQSTTGSELEETAYTFVNVSTGNYFENYGGLQKTEENVWTSHAVYYDSETRKYAIRLTNNATDSYGGNYFLSVFGVFIEASTETEPVYIWNISSVDAPISTYVDVSKAGTLSNYVKAEDATVTGLMISGELNGNDISLLRGLPNLSLLDLSDASIVAGGDVYYKNYQTSDNTIGDSMFVNRSLTQIVLPETIDKIGNYAFRGCDSLHSIVIPEGVTSIGKYAFSECASLSSVVFEAKACNVGYSTENGYYPPFRGCPLTSVTFGEQVTIIPDALFWDIEHEFTFLSVDFPGTLTQIGNYAFYGCNRLTSIIIPQGVTSLGCGAFSACMQLSKLDYEAVNCSPDYRIGEEFYTPFKDCPLATVTFGDSVKSIPAGLLWNSENSFTFISAHLPDALEQIGDYAFSECKLFVVTIPENVTSIGCHAFYGCSSLHRLTYNAIDCAADYVKDSVYYTPFKLCELSGVTIGEKVETIPTGLLWNSGNTFTFTKVTLPKSLKKLGERAFRECVYLSNVVCPIEKPLEITHNVFHAIELENCTLTVPAGSSSSYQNTWPWKQFGTVVEE